MKEEVQQKIDKVRSQLTDLDSQYLVKSASYKEKINELNQDYMRQKEKFQQITDNALTEKSQELTKEIELLKAQQNTRIATLTATYEKEKEKLGENFQTFSDEINMKKAALTEEIKAFEQRQAAIVEQFKKDEEIRKQRDFYHIVLTESEKEDVKKLRLIADELHNPTILYKLIWENYYRNKFSDLVGRIVGNNKKAVGIYKITNINNEKIYIGQTKAGFENRWRTHIRRGLKAEPTTNNKLYAEMWSEGPENFTWEIVEYCSENELNEKEKFYISFYKSMEWGYNAKS